MTVLVLGASGYTGRSVTRALANRDVPVRAFIRRPEAEAVALADGASEIVLGNLLDLRAVEDAARGADGIFFIGPRFMPEETELAEAVIAIAARCGVRRFVLSGVYHPTIRDLANHRAKVRVEDALYRSDLEFVVLQPARFMHGLLLSSWSRLLEDGVLADAFDPGNPMSYVDYRDVAEVVAIAFAEDRLVRGTFELAAEGEHALHDLAAACEGVLGRTIQAEQIPLESYAPARSLLRNPYSADGFNRLRSYYDAHGFRGGNSMVLRTILGREPADFAAALRNLLDTRKETQ